MDTTINWLHIFPFGPLLIAIAIFTFYIINNDYPDNKYLWFRIAIGVIGAGIIAYHTFKLIKTGSSLYLMHMLFGALLLTNGIAPSKQIGALLGGVGVAAMGYHGYLINVKRNAVETV